MNLHPEHLADLKKSGLSDEMIERANIHTVPPGDISKRMGANYPQVISALSFPYNGNGFERLKLFPSHKDRDGHSVRYFQKGGSEIQLYVPPGVETVLSDAKTPLLVTEGEKKALKATQEGIPTIGIGGVWNWTPDLFNRLAILDRNIELVPDSDFLTNANVLLAVYRLGKLLEKRGAEVCIVCLPAGIDKCGLDDFLVSHTVDEFQALKRIGTDHDIFKKNRCTEAVKPSSPTPKTNYSANSDGLVDLVLDEGRVRYLIARPDGSPTVLESFEKDGKKFVPPPVKQIPFSIADLAEVKAAYLTDEPGRLFADIVLHLQKISQLPSENHLVLLAAWVFSTYRQEVLPYSGYLAFFNVAGRGKTRTGKALISAAYRGVHTITIREANLFRLSQDLQASIFFDVTDLSGKLARNDCEDVILSRFEKGARVFRTLFPDKGPFEDTVSFDIFGPSIIATNVALYRVLDTRCFPISMPHSGKHFPAPNPAEGLKLRERLLAWRAKQLFKPLADPGKIMAGRLGDIAMPLRSILQEVKPEAIPAFDELIEQMQQAGREDKSQSLEARIVRCVKSLAIADMGGEIPVSEIASKLNQGIGQDSKAFVNPWRVGRLLKALGFKRGRSSQKRHIEVDKEDLESMCQEYGIEEVAENLPEASQTSQCHSSTDGPSDISGDVADTQMSLPDTDGEVTL